MATFLLVFVLLLLIVAAMAVGVMFGRAPIKGSCGGIAALTGVRDCELCGGDRGKCDEINGRGNDAGGRGAGTGTVGRYEPPRDS